MLLTIALILFVLWLLGGLVNITGGALHFLLVLAVIVVVYDLIKRRV